MRLREQMAHNGKAGDIVGGRYRIVRLIGQGGMGLVYAVEDLKLNGMIRAMKVGTGGRTNNEAAALMKLSHPNLPHLLDCCPAEESGGVDALVMDYFEGETIAEAVARSGGGISCGGLLHIGLQLCSALAYLHGQQLPIIHRDLKPSNVMIDRQGHVKLIDFGIARQYKEGRQDDTARLGTAGFAAPEQLSGGPSDARTDIYGLGALLHYIASDGGLAPGAGADRSSLRSARLPKRFPQPLRAAIERMLQPDPAYRYGSMDEVRAALLACGEQPQAWQWEDRTAIGARPERIGVLSLSPGAGATFVAITLAALLGGSGYSVAAAEYEGLQPEWAELLRLRQPGPDDAAPFGAPVTGLDDAGAGGAAGGNVRWLAAHERLGGALAGERLPGLELLEQLGKGAGVGIVDFSGCWEDAPAMHWLQQARHVLAVADPNVYKWQVAKLRRLAELQRELAGRGGTLHWIANKDVQFPGRREWLSLFPAKPLAAIPLLPPDEVLAALWSGQWVTDRGALHRRLARAFRPVCEATAARR